MLTTFGGLLFAALSGFGPNATDDSIQKYQAELQLNPKNSLAHFRLGELFLDQHNFQSAANEFKEALKGDPHPRWIDAWAHIKLGELFDATNQQERAVLEYRLAARTKDDTEGAQAAVAEHLNRLTPAGDIHSDRILVRYITTPKVIRQTPPEYSREARIAELEGTVSLAATIAADGSVADVRVLEPLGLDLDEAAEACIKRWSFKAGITENGPAPMLTTVSLNFLLQTKMSRWHLLRVAFDAAEGTSRPRFAHSSYPAGDGISRAAAEEASLIAAMGRQALVTLSFEVDRAGRPGHFVVRKATEPVWGREAISFVSRWKFYPGSKDGAAVSVPCTVDLIWGEKQFTEESLRWVSEAFQEER